MPFAVYHNTTENLHDFIMLFLSLFSFLIRRNYTKKNLLQNVNVFLSLTQSPSGRGEE